MSTPLTTGEIDVALGELQGWTREGGALAKTYGFRTFREAFGFMTRVAFEAEALKHHPDWSNAYNKVVVRLTTHDAGGKVTSKDVELARRMERIERGERT